jgi:hypothetical protein
MSWRFFMSGEIDGKIHQDYNKLSLEIEAKIKLLEANDYGSEVVDIGIIMIIIDPRRRLFEEGFFRERKLIRRKSKGADIRLRTDFDKFQAADHEGRRLLLLDNVIRSLKVITERVKKDFKGEQLISDVYQLFNIKPEDLDNL